MNPKFHSVIAATMLVVPMALSRAALAGACVPGQQVACACPAGGSGTQVCADDGESYQPCVCAPAAFEPPAPDRREDPSSERRNKGLMIAGIVLASVGGAGVLAGSAMVAAGHGVDYQSSAGTYNVATGTTSSPSYSSCGVEHAFDRGDCAAIGAGLVMIGFAGSLITAGVIMAPLGARRVEPQGATTMVTLGPNGASFSISF